MCEQHEDLSPLEICASTLSKELEEVGTEIKEQQQLWLWQQGELVRFTQEKQAHSSSVQTLRTQFTILQQSKINRKSMYRTHIITFSDILKDSDGVLKTRRFIS